MATASPDRPLEGRSVLVTRPAERAASLARGLRELGARVETRPTIVLEAPDDPLPARGAVGSLAEYDWLLFTSPSGVQFFFERAREAYGEQLPQLPSIGAIGPATARALQARGAPVALVAAESHAEGFARAIEGRIGGGHRVLLVRPEVARPLLGEAVRETGAELDAVVFYRNVPAGDLPETVESIVNGRFDVVIFTSPSTLTRLLDSAGADARALRESLAKAAIVAIGRVTEAALQRNALQADVVAARPSDAGLIEAVCSLFPVEGLC